MNTSLKISLLSDTQAQYRANEITRNIDPARLKNPINIEKVIDNKIDIKPDIILTDDEKKVRIQLQKNLHIYKKRLEKAIKDNKPKSINTNQKKVNEIEQQLKSQQVTNLNKKDYLEVSLHLTNSNFDPKTFNHYELFKKFIEEHKAFSKLEIIKLAYHKDQHSPHAHILFDVSKIKDFGKFLKNNYTNETDTREIFSKIQNEFNAYATKYFSNHELGEDMRDVQTQRKGVKYMSKNQYKEFTKIRDEILQETGMLINQVDYSKLILKRNIQDGTRRIYKIDRRAKEYLLRLPEPTNNEHTTKGLDSNVYRDGDTQIQSTPTGTRGVADSKGMQLQGSINANVRENQTTEKLIKKQSFSRFIKKSFTKIYTNITNKINEYIESDNEKTEAKLAIKPIQKIQADRQDNNDDYEMMFEIQDPQRDNTDDIISTIELLLELEKQQARKRVDNEQLHQKEEKTSLSTVSDDLNDKKEQSNSLSNLEKMIDDINKAKDEDKKAWDKALAIFDGTYVEEADKTSLSTVSDDLNDTKQEPTIKKPHRLR